jgi:hypothetical protein
MRCTLDVMLCEVGLPQVRKVLSNHDGINQSVQQLEFESSNSVFPSSPCLHFGRRPATAAAGPRLRREDIPGWENTQWILRYGSCQMGWLGQIKAIYWSPPPVGGLPFKLRRVASEPGVASSESTQVRVPEKAAAALRDLSVSPGRPATHWHWQDRGPSPSLTPADSDCVGLRPRPRPRRALCQ